MVKVNVNGTEMYLDGYLQANLDNAKKNIRKDWDYLFVIDGEVGAGKSVFAQQIAHYCSDGKLKIENICFNPEQFKKSVVKAEKYDAVIFDEAFRGLSARAAMTSTNRVVVSMLQEIRQKNLFVFIVLPSIWDVDKYVALHRCKGLFHVDTGYNKQRGFFKFYKREKLTMMFANPMKWRYKYPAAPQFKGRFTKFYPINEEEYRKKKEDSLGEYAYSNDDKESNFQKKLKKRIVNLSNELKKLGYKNSDLSPIWDETTDNVRRSLREWRFKPNFAPLGSTNLRMEEDDDGNE